MFRTLRSRLLVGIAPLLAIMVGLGLWAVVMFSRLGGNIDVILRENYRSVLAAQNMKEALERMDSALLFAIGGQEARAREQFQEFRPAFEENLRHRAGQRHPARASRQIGRRAGVASTPATSTLTRALLRPAAVRRRGADDAVLQPAAPDVQPDQGPGRRRPRPQPEEHGGHGPPGAHGRRGVDPRDDRRPARVGRRRHADRAGAEPVDPRADPGGDARRPRDGPGRPRPGRARPLPRRAGRAGRRLQRDGPHASASSSRPGPPGSCGPRRRRRRRSTRSPTRWWSSTRRARSSGPTRRPAASSA